MPYFYMEQVLLNYSYTENLFPVPPNSQESLTFARNKTSTMYERKIPIDLECPLRLTLSFMGPKWNTCILDELRHGPLRPSQLHRALPAATPRVLNMQLKELEADGLVRKVIYPELPPRSEYYLTELGESLLPIIDAMTEWGERHRECFDKK